MTEIKNLALDRAIKLLEAAGCSYAIVNADGEKFGALEIVAQEERKRSPLRYPYGAISGHYKPQIKIDAPVGSVQVVSIGSFTADEIRSGICSWLSREWGSDSYISNITDEGTVEVLRVA
jgi:hypothetical protein